MARKDAFPEIPYVRSTLTKLFDRQIEEVEEVACLNYLDMPLGPHVNFFDM